MFVCCLFNFEKYYLKQDFGFFALKSFCLLNRKRSEINYLYTQIETVVKTMVIKWNWLNGGALQISRCVIYFHFKPWPLWYFTQTASSDYKKPIENCLSFSLKIIVWRKVVLKLRLPISAWPFSFGIHPAHAWKINF